MSRWELASVLVAVLLGSGAGQLPFDCPQLPPLQHPAKSVYELRPQDIKVILSLGDSVTAGGSIYIYIDSYYRIAYCTVWASALVGA